jgi:hypothetical protein
VPERRATGQGCCISIPAWWTATVVAEKHVGKVSLLQGTCIYVGLSVATVTPSSNCMGEKR